MDSAVALFVNGAIVSLLSSVVTVLLNYCVQTMREKLEYHPRFLERPGKQEKYIFRPIRPLIPTQLATYYKIKRDRLQSLGKVDDCPAFRQYEKKLKKWL